jgi:pre-mRNA-processing factor 6
MGWIAAARIEHLDGKIQEARNIINQALQELPNDEDIWLEAAKICAPEKVQALLTKAICNLPKSKRLW